MSNALKTLFVGLRESGLGSLGPDDHVLFLNAQASTDTTILRAAYTVYQQYFKPFANDLEAAGIYSVTELPDRNIPCRLALIKMPKSQVESEYFVALALDHLGEGGMLICAADNKGGGARIPKTLKKFGLDEIESISKNKARVCIAKKRIVDEKICERAIKDGARQRVLNGQFVSQPGMFGWNKEDQGSKILVEHLPYSFLGIY
ncbi:MAG: hypothetical protein AAF182_03955 [Pseudomonadota bacterium]